MTPEQRSDVRSSGSSRTRHLFGRARDPVPHRNATAAERIAQYPCDRYVQSPGERFTRAVGVESPPETVFRCLCQLKVAPYSYDWTGTPGRRSPRSLTPEVDRLEPGQEFLVFWLVEFEQNRHIKQAWSSRVRSVSSVGSPSAMSSSRATPVGAGSWRASPSRCLPPFSNARASRSSPSEISS